MKCHLVAIALFGLAVPALSAQLNNTDPPYQTICRSALAKPFTPPPTDPSLKPDCDSTASYFGIGRPVDFVAARACAYAEYGQPEADTSNNIFFGPGVLSMIYANGQGTPADLDLAVRFTCEKFAAPAEIEARLDVLTAAREDHAAIVFDLCDQATSGNAITWCASVQARLSTLDRNARLEKLRAGLSPPATAALVDLQKAEDAFIRLHLDNEVDLNGADHGALQLTEDNDLRDQWIADLERVTAAGFHEEVELKAADKKLSAAMRPVQIAKIKARLPHATKTVGETTIRFQGIEEAQQSWLQVRETWGTFAQTVTSVTNADKQAEALVTLERAQQLRGLLEPESKAQK